MEKPYTGLAWRGGKKKPARAPREEPEEPVYPDGSAAAECWNIRGAFSSPAEKPVLQEKEKVL